MSNMRQIDLAFTQYAGDYDDVFPASSVGADGAGKVGGWIYYSVCPAAVAGGYDPKQGSIYPYVKSPGIFICPDDTVGRTSGNSYSVNGCAWQSWDGTVGFVQAKSLTALGSASEWVLLDEEADASGSTDDGYYEYQVNPLSIRHHLGLNLAFVDGHTKWFHPEAAMAAGYFTGGQSLDQCP